MSLRKIAGVLQLPLAGIGALAVFFSLTSAASLAPPEGEGFVTGLAMVFLYILGGTGYLVTVGALLLPPSGRYSVSFSCRQRTLLKLSLLSGLPAIYGPFLLLGPALALQSFELPAAIWGISVFLSVSGFLAATLWKTADALREKLQGR